MVPSDCCTYRCIYNIDGGPSHIVVLLQYSEDCIDDVYAAWVVYTERSITSGMLEGRASDHYRTISPWQQACIGLCPSWQTYNGLLVSFKLSSRDEDSLIYNSVYTCRVLMCISIQITSLCTLYMCIKYRYTRNLCQYVTFIYSRLENLESMTSVWIHFHNGG